MTTLAGLAGFLGIVVVACCVVAVCVVLVIDFATEVHADHTEARTLRDAVALFDIDFIPEMEDVAAAEAALPQLDAAKFTGAP